jgi:pimeloyl-ACP methyl ester carboxylesterase
MGFLLSHGALRGMLNAENKTKGSDPMKTMQVNGVTLAYKEFGTGDKILLSTQNFFFSECHMELLARQPYNYHVYLIYMRGYGESTHIFDPEPKDYATIWGEDVLAFADAIGAKTFFYSGVSHGCWAGWYIAFHHPERLRGFASTSGCCVFIPREMRKAVPPRPEMDYTKVVGDREALAKIAWNTFEPTEDPVRLARRAARHEEHIDILMGRKAEEFTVRNNNMLCVEAGSQEEFDEKLKAIRAPICVIVGLYDRTDAAFHATSLIPGAKLVTYRHLGHAGPDECPELLAAECDFFFRTFEGRTL